MIATQKFIKTYHFLTEITMMMITITITTLVTTATIKPTITPCGITAKKQDITKYSIAQT